MNTERDYHYCGRHKEYEAIPYAKICGECGDLLLRERKPSKLPSLLIGIGLGLAALAFSASELARNVEIPSNYVKITSMTRAEQLTILDKNKNGRIDGDESRNLVVRNFGLYYTGK